MRAGRAGCQQHRGCQSDGERPEMREFLHV
jgi:hypothetical protein